MKKLLASLAALCALFAFNPASAQAQEHSPTRAYSKIGVGFTNVAAPLGVRMWINPSIGFDANIGLALNGNADEIETTDGDDETITANFDLDLGLLIAVWRKKDSQSTAFIRVGYHYDRDYAAGADDMGALHSNVTTNNISVLFGVEWFLAELGVPNLALQAALGLNIQIISPVQTGADAPDTTWGLASNQTGLGFLDATFGFHYYFF